MKQQMVYLTYQETNGTESMCPEKNLIRGKFLWSANVDYNVKNLHVRKPGFQRNAVSFWGPQLNVFWSIVVDTWTLIPGCYNAIENFIRNL